MASNQRKAREIQARMATLREHMEVSVNEAATRARQWSDWRYFVKRFPLTATVLAAGVGYLLVPRRYRVVVPDAKSLAKLVKNEQLVISQRPSPMGSGFVTQKVLGIVAASVARAALSYIGDRLLSGSADGRVEAHPERRQPPTGSEQPARSQVPRHPR
jgi:hypothetical protein